MLTQVAFLIGSREIDVNIGFTQTMFIPFEIINNADLSITIQWAYYRA